MCTRALFWEGSPELPTAAQRASLPKRSKPDSSIVFSFQVGSPQWPEHGVNRFFYNPMKGLIFLSSTFISRWLICVFKDAF